MRCYQLDGPAATEDAESAKQTALAAELRALASQGSSVRDSSPAGRKRKAADSTDSVATFADAEESAVVDPAVAKRAKGMADDFLEQMAAAPAAVQQATVAPSAPSTVGVGRGQPA